MDEDWMDDFLNERDARRGDSQHQAQLHNLALERTADMFRRLHDRIKGDIDKYTARTGHRVTFSSKGTYCEVQTHEFPSIFLRLDLIHGGIQVRTSIRESSGAQNEPAESIIEIIAKGQDQIYFRLAGENLARESQVSARLLKPLLALLA